MHRTFSTAAASALGLLLAWAGPLAAAEDYLFWHDDYQEALAEAKKTGKPIFLEYRCAP